VLVEALSDRDPLVRKHAPWALGRIASPSVLSALSAALGTRTKAIDQAIAESIGHFNAQVEQARNLLLGILGHDMRNPLNNMLMTAQYLASLNAGDTVSVAGQADPQRRLHASPAGRPGGLQPQ
jgi:signal transduction histidine kinase